VLAVRVVPGVSGSLGTPDAPAVGSTICLPGVGGRPVSILGGVGVSGVLGLSGVLVIRGVSGLSGSRGMRDAPGVGSTICLPGVGGGPISLLHVICVIELSGVPNLLPVRGAPGV
jgi:hypothetical protein